MTDKTGTADLSPALIELVGEEVAVRWEDGHESFYTTERLRAHCPCALCKTRRADTEPASSANPLRVLSSREAAGPTARVLRYEPVGRYGVRFLWSDRHDTGIYDFRLLRGICPCEACR